jgi:hypothetical protein
MKIYGPYTRADGRKHIIIVHDDGTRQTKSYPRYLLEQYLGRELTDEETVDHINHDFTDDRIENLQILSQSDNARKEMSRECRKRKLYKFICPQCGKDGEKELRAVIHNWNLGKAGPFCSRNCAGRRNAKFRK